MSRRISIPTPPRTYAAEFPRLDGGVNLRELDYRMDPDQSPDMVNLWWRDGALQCRDGQHYAADSPGGAGFAAAGEPFHGFAVLHIGDSLYCARPGPDMVLRTLWSGLGESAGTFFRYDGSLFYKNRGGYVRVDAVGDALRASDAAADAYVPVTLLNASPADGSGDPCQPRNRLSGGRRVRYNPDGSTVYRLPEGGVDAVTSVTAEGTVLSPGTDYSVNLASGEVTFTCPPPVREPPVNNAVEISYVKADAAARAEVMDCPIAVAAGEGRGLCVLLSGGAARPNAVYWNGNNAAGMDPSYFPDTYYNLCGDAGDPVTGFGLQHSDLIVFQRRGLGKLELTVESVEGRDTLAFGWRRLHAGAGCDRPGTVALVENNLVFCSAARGALRLNSASPALEHAVTCVSEKVHGAGRGLLTDLQADGQAVAWNDGRRYWVCANGHAWVWDYSISTPERPSWFYFTNVRPRAFFRDEAGGLYYLDGEGRVTAFDRGLADYGGAIEKRYSFPALSLGGYLRRKDVTGLVLAVRGDADTEIHLCYDTDFERRRELTPVRCWAWRLTPRNLSRRCLAGGRFGHAERRDPKCRGVRHFALTVWNDAVGEDLAVVSLTVYYHFVGKEK